MLSVKNNSFLPVTRIAPTPSGYLHLGNIFNFILTYLVAKSNDGKVFLRIDDIDSDRMRISYLDDIFYQLDKLGIAPDGGPGSVEEHLNKFSQHHRMQTYQNALNKLKEDELIFNCACSRKSLKEYTDVGYPGTCLDKQIPYQAHQTAIRLKNKKGISVKIKDLKAQSRQYPIPDNMAYNVLWRKDNLPSYQLTSVCDDTAMNINCVVRGSDLLPSSLFQIYLAHQLEFNFFADIRFLHHGLLKDDGDRKLSKSQGSTPANNLTAKEIMAAFIAWAGWKISTDNLQDIVDYIKSNDHALASVVSLSGS